MSHRTIILFLFTLISLTLGVAKNSVTVSHRSWDAGFCFDRWRSLHLRQIFDYYLLLILQLSVLVTSYFN